MYRYATYCILLSEPQRDLSVVGHVYEMFALHGSTNLDKADNCCIVTFVSIIGAVFNILWWHKDTCMLIIGYWSEIVNWDFFILFIY